MYRVLRRAGIILLTLLIVSFMVFLLQDLSLGDSSSYLLSEEAGEEEISLYRESMNLDDPFLVRYGSFLASFIKGEWGVSANGLDIKETVMRRIPATLSLTIFSIALAVVISVPLSVFAVRNRKIGKAVSLFSILIMSLPSFMIAVFLVMIFSVHLKIFPPAGYISIVESFSGFLRTMFLPSFTLSLLHSSLYLRIFRKALDENLAKPFSMAMAAMGMKKKDLVMKSAFAPSLPVLASLLAGSFATAASGSAVTETIFAIPGIGSLLVDAALTRDTALSGILIIFIALAVSLMSAVAELLFFILDPRTRRR